MGVHGSGFFGTCVEKVSRNSESCRVENQMVFMKAARDAVRSKRCSLKRFSDKKAWGQTGFVG